MSKYPFFLRWIFLPLATVLGVALTMTARIEALGGEAARLDGFTQADGVGVFALTLKPPAPAVDGPRDVVILFSTAASQAGDFRAKSLATLQATLSKLESRDRVKLVAFDLNAVPLTRGFVAPGSPAMTEAFAALLRRTPLGSCDLEKALDTAAKSFADSKSARAIVYFGDGSSRANPLSTGQLDRMVGDLLSVRAPLIAFGVGLQIQEQVLGALASRSGGLVAAEAAGVDAGLYGSGLARAVHAAVLWPKAGSVKWPAGMDVYPQIFPPLRSDRDTVLVGTTKSTVAQRVQIDVEGPAGGRTLGWDIPPLRPSAANCYLATLVDQAKCDGGRTLPLIDSASLSVAKRQIEAGGRGLASLAVEALKGGNLESANRLADAALRRNPNDLAARAVLDAVANRGGPARAAADKAARSAPAAGDLVLQDDVPAGTQQGAAAEREIVQSAALAEQWHKDVRNTIDLARSQVSVETGKAAATIRNKTNDLLAETGLPAEVRERLMGLLRTAGREIRCRGEEVAFRQQQQIREAMAQREMEMTHAALVADQTKTKQLMDRFNYLMAEGRHKLAEEAVQEANKIAERSAPSERATMLAAALNARLGGAYDDIMVVRVAKQKGFVDASYQTEKSHVPAADDPSIVYADAEAWKELTARRRDKYGAAEFSRRSPAEKKIEEALKQPTQIEFVETPLKDVVDYLKDLHHIEIQLDTAALREVDVDENTPISKNLKGISLRSALKLLLDDLQLTFVVHNEVLLITSAAKAAQSDEFMTTKAYPVTDIVVPIKQSGFTGGFGRIGGQGNSPLGGSNQGGQGRSIWGGPMQNANPLGGGNGNPLGGMNPPGGGNGNPFGGGNPFGN